MWTEGNATPLEFPANESVYAYRVERIPDPNNYWEMDPPTLQASAVAEHRDALGWHVERLRDLGVTKEQIEGLFYEAFRSHFG